MKYIENKLNANIVKLKDTNNNYTSDNVEGALEEIDSKIKNIEDNGYDDTQIKQDIVNIKTEIGTEELTTTDQTIKGAVNEIDSQIKDNAIKLQNIYVDVSDFGITQSNDAIVNDIKLSELSNLLKNTKATIKFNDGTYSVTKTPNLFGHKIVGTGNFTDGVTTVPVVAFNDDYESYPQNGIYKMIYGWENRIESDWENYAKYYNLFLDRSLKVDSDSLSNLYILYKCHEVQGKVLVEAPFNENGLTLDIEVINKFINSFGKHKAVFGWYCEIFWNTTVTKQREYYNTFKPLSNDMKVVVEHSGYPQSDWEARFDPKYCDLLITYGYPFESKDSKKGEAPASRIARMCQTLSNYNVETIPLYHMFGCNDSSLRWRTPTLDECVYEKLYWNKGGYYNIGHYKWRNRNNKNGFFGLIPVIDENTAYWELCKDLLANACNFQQRKLNNKTLTREYIIPINNVLGETVDNEGKIQLDNKTYRVLLNTNFGNIRGNEAENEKGYVEIKSFNFQIRNAEISSSKPVKLLKRRKLDCGLDEQEVLVLSEDGIGANNVRRYSASKSDGSFIRINSELTYILEFTVFNCNSDKSLTMMDRIAYKVSDGN